MEPMCVNGSVHTARKQHQRVCVRICARVLCVNVAYIAEAVAADVRFPVHPVKSSAYSWMSRDHLLTGVFLLPLVVFGGSLVETIILIRLPVNE